MQQKQLSVNHFSIIPSLFSITINLIKHFLFAFNEAIQQWIYFSLARGQPPCYVPLVLFVAMLSLDIPSCSQHMLNQVANYSSYFIMFVFWFKHFHWQCPPRDTILHSGSLQCSCYRSILEGSQDCKKSTPMFYLVVYLL